MQSRGQCGGRWDHSECWTWEEELGLAGPETGTQENEEQGCGLAALYISEGRRRNLQENARGNIYIKEFPGCSGLGPATALHNFASGFSPPRSRHHPPSPNTSVSSLRYLGTLDRGGYLGGTLMQVFVSQAVLPWFMLGSGECSGVPEANQGFRSLPGNLEIRAVESGKLADTLQCTGWPSTQRMIQSNVKGPRLCSPPPQVRGLGVLDQQGVPRNYSSSSVCQDLC